MKHLTSSDGVESDRGPGKDGIGEIKENHPERENDRRAGSKPGKLDKRPGRPEGQGGGRAADAWWGSEGMVMVRRKDYQGSVFVATRLVNGRDAEDALFAARNAPLMVKIFTRSSHPQASTCRPS